MCCGVFGVNFWVCTFLGGFVTQFLRFCFRRFLWLLLLNRACRGLHRNVQKCAKIVRRFGSQFLCCDNCFWHCAAGMQFGACLHRCSCYCGAETTFSDAMAFVRSSASLHTSFVQNCHAHAQNCCRIVAVTIFIDVWWAVAGLLFFVEGLVGWVSVYTGAWVM